MVPSYFICFSHSLTYCSDDNAFGALVDYLSKDELCLKIMLDDTAILVFSSLQLPHHYWSESEHL